MRAKRAWLKEDITRRFGVLPEDVAARLDGIESEDQFDAVKNRLATVASLDQLFA